MDAQFDGLMEQVVSSVSSEEGHFRFDRPSSAENSEGRVRNRDRDRDRDRGEDGSISPIRYWFLFHNHRNHSNLAGRSKSWIQALLI